MFRGPALPTRYIEDIRYCTGGTTCRYRKCSLLPSTPPFIRVRVRPSPAHPNPAPAKLMSWSVTVKATSKTAGAALHVALGGSRAQAAHGPLLEALESAVEKACAEFGPELEVDIATYGHLGPDGGNFRLDFRTGPQVAPPAESEP